MDLNALTSWEINKSNIVFYLYFKITFCTSQLNLKVSRPIGN